MHIVQDVFEVQVVVVVFDSFSYAALEQGGRLTWREEAETQRRGGHRYLTVSIGMYRTGEHVRQKFTFFSKMRAMVSATAWRSSSTQRTQRNCGGRKDTLERTSVKIYGAPV